MTLIEPCVCVGCLSSCIITKNLSSAVLREMRCTLDCDRMSIIMFAIIRWNFFAQLRWTICADCSWVRAGRMPFRHRYPAHHLQRCGIQQTRDEVFEHGSFKRKQFVMTREECHVTCNRFKSQGEPCFSAYRARERKPNYLVPAWTLKQLPLSVKAM